MLLLQSSSVYEVSALKAQLGLRGILPQLCLRTIGSDRDLLGLWLSTKVRLRLHLWGLFTIVARGRGRRAPAITDFLGVRLGVLGKVASGLLVRAWYSFLRHRDCLELGI